jgi:hypothetical protein
MNSVDSFILLLTNQYISETAIPTNYLHIPVIIDTINRYKWMIGYSHTNGWTNLIRVLHYSS